MNDVVSEIGRLQHSIATGFGPSKLFSLEWLNEICSHLTRICQEAHQLLANKEHKFGRNAIDTIFLALRQLTCCINHLERVLLEERAQSVELKLCRQHFQECMSFGLKRLNDVLTTATDRPADYPQLDANFVTYMDQAIDLITPISLQLTLDSGDQPPVEITETKFIQVSRQAREVIELLIGQTLAFLHIACEKDKVALKAYMQLVMKECIALQEMCLGYDSNDQEINASDRDKRLQAQQLQNALYNLDRLMNEAFLRVFYTTFGHDMEPMLQESSPLVAPYEHKIQQFAERFDRLLDHFIQIGLFAAAYTSSPKAKSHLLSYVATFEALGVSLVPAISSMQFEHDADFLVKHWNETVAKFQHSVQQTINTQAFTLILVDWARDLLDGLDELNASAYDRAALRGIVTRAGLLLQHVKINGAELRLSGGSPLKMCLDDFTLIWKECVAVNKPTRPVAPAQIKKRFNVLVSVLEKMAQAAGQAMAGHGADEDNKPFTFGDVTAPTDHGAGLKSVDQERRGKVAAAAATESMAVMLDWNEFVAKNETVQRQLKSRTMTFYESRYSARAVPRFPVHPPPPSPPTTANKKRTPNTIKGGKQHDTKRVSKRLSLRVAMFKRQKLLDTQRFLNDVTNKSSESVPIGSFNLQITDILDQLTVTTVSVGSPPDQG